MWLWIVILSHFPFSSLLAVLMERGTRQSLNTLFSFSIIPSFSLILMLALTPLSSVPALRQGNDLWHIKIAHNPRPRAVGAGVYTCNVCQNYSESRLWITAAPRLKKPSLGEGITATISSCVK